MEKIFKSFVLICVLALSLSFFAAACKPKEVAPTPTAVVPMTPATEVPAGK